LNEDAVDEFNDFLKGAIAMGYATAALFFLRFYWRAADRLFLMFAASFILLGVIRVCMVFWNDPMEHHFLYWIRFAAYLLILAAIIDKNLPRARKTANPQQRAA
jgi:hypothetical protein